VGGGDDAAEVAAEVVGKELFKIHYGGVVFGGEPFAALAHFIAANVCFATISAALGIGGASDKSLSIPRKYGIARYDEKTRFLSTN